MLVSLTSSIAKVVEKAKKNSIVSLLSKYVLLSENHYNFREDTGDNEATRAVVKITYEALDAFLYSIAVFFDLKL